MFLFAESFEQSFGQFLLTTFCIVGFIGGLLKRTDRSGSVRKAALNAGGRGLFKLFTSLIKR